MHPSPHYITQFSLIERTRRTNQLTRKQIFKINDKSSRKKFAKAVERNQVSKAVKMLNKGMDPNFVTETGSKFFHILISACSEVPYKNIN